MKGAIPREYFIRSVLISDPSSPFNGRKIDLHLKDGVIHKAGKGLKEPFGAGIIEGKGLIACPGFADLHVNLQDPGFEFKEDIRSALGAASAGGYTGILSISSTSPAVDNKSSVEYQLSKAGGSITDLWVTGSISKGGEGQELSEMYDMHLAGAKAFCDFKSDIKDSRLLELALLYTKSFNGLIMVHPGEYYLSRGGMVNEGNSGTKSGLPGIPGIAEELGIHRAIRLADYTDQAVHINSISTKEGIDLMRRAKKSRIRVSCGVCIASLFFNEESISGFDTNFKLNPPLRDEKTRKLLIEALKEGVIDVVISDHWPQNRESKDCEFDQAEFGMNTIESTFAMLSTATSGIIYSGDVLAILSRNPRRILGIEIPVIEPGAAVNMTIVQADAPWEYQSVKSLSRSSNFTSPGKLNGKVVATLNKEKVFVNP